MLRSLWGKTSQQWFHSRFVFNIFYLSESQTESDLPCRSQWNTHNNSDICTSVAFNTSTAQFTTVTQPIYLSDSSDLQRSSLGEKPGGLSKCLRLLWSSYTRFRRPIHRCISIIASRNTNGKSRCVHSDLIGYSICIVQCERSRWNYLDITLSMPSGHICFPSYNLSILRMYLSMAAGLLSNRMSRHQLIN